MGTKVYDNYADLITFNRNSKGTALRPIGYGDELVTNGTFDTDSDWVEGGLWTISGGVATQPAGASPDYLRQSDVLTIGKVYQYSIEVVSGNGSNFPQLYTEAGVVASFTSGVGTYTGIFVAAGNDVWIRALSPTIDVSVDNVSVKEVLFDREADPLTLFLHPEGVPRIEYDADRNLKGLLIEPESTNQIRNGSGTGAVVGTPGTFPLYWNISDGGLTREIVATGTENGVAYVDIKLSGTASTNSAVIFLEATTTISATGGETWTQSVFLKEIDATSNYDDIYFRAYNYTSAPSYVNVNNGSSLTVTTDLERYESTWTLSGATIASSNPSILFSLTNGNTYDFTIRIGLAQYEESPIATSYMPTTGSTFTRGKDEASMTNVSGLIGQKEGTLYVEVYWQNDNVSQGLLDISNGYTDNRVMIYNSFGTSANMYIAAGGTLGVINQGVSSTAFTGIKKLAFTYEKSATATCKLFIDGTLESTATNQNTDALTGLNEVIIGGQPIGSGVSEANMHIRAIQIIPRRLSDEQLIELTS